MTKCLEHIEMSDDLTQKIKTLVTVAIADGCDQYDERGTFDPLIGFNATAQIKTSTIEALREKWPEEKEIPIQRHAGGYSDLNTLCEQHNNLGFNEALKQAWSVVEQELKEKL